MHQECPLEHFLPIYVAINITVFRLIKDKEEVGVTLLTVVSLCNIVMAALKEKFCP